MSDNNTSRPPAVIGRLTPAKQLAALLEAQDARERVQALPSVQLNRLLSHFGLVDATDLLALASAQQLREVVDLQIWTGDRLDLDELLDWAHALLQASPDALGALDVELIGLLLLRHAQIYLLEEEEVPEPPAGTVWITPERWFALDIAAEDERAGLLIELLETLYANDQEEARRLLQNLRWELPTELTENAYRWRCGRMEDLGFANPLEALRIYAYLDPASVDPEQDRTADRSLAADPDPVGRSAELTPASPAAETSFWTRAVGRLGEDERERVGRATMSVANQTLSADQVPATETELAEQSLDALHWRLSLGLEHLSQGQLDGAAAVLSGVAVQRVARVGHSLALDLRQELLVVSRGRRLGRTIGGLDLLHRPLRERLSPLLGQRPQIFDEAEGLPRPIRTLEELRGARHWIADAALTAALVPDAARPDPVPGDLTLADLFCTAVANRLLGRAEDQPIGAIELTRLLAEQITDGALGPAWYEGAMALAAERLGATLDEQAPARELIERWLTSLGEQLGTLPTDDLDLRFVAGLHLG